ncbi:hypothetical protein ACFL4K_02335 [Candidatus Neomarinimicrobiota bacterium]
MITSEIVGDIVQVILRDPADLATLGLEKPSLFLHVVGVDELGVWTAHPGYPVTRINDDEGKPLPAEEQIRTEVDANFLIRWEQIATIVHFPNRKGFDFPSPYEKHIGFVIPEDEMKEDGKEEDS